MVKPGKNEEPEDYLMFELDSFIRKQIKNMSKVYNKKFGYNEIANIIVKDINLMLSDE
jgi:hypothetical protein